MIFDTHAHYDDAAFDNDRYEVIESLQKGGVRKVCNVGAGMHGSRESVRLSEMYDFIYAVVGVHPDEVKELNEDTFAELKELALKKKTVAIGEIGLDYHGFDMYEDKPDKELQMYWFERQIDLAIELDLPVVIHSRNAALDTMNIIHKAHDKGLKKLEMHCFSYSKEIADECVSMGYYLGFGGSLTYEGQKKITKALMSIPEDRILLETDCPYLTPVPYRGNRNCSLYLTAVRDRIAEVRGITPDEVEQLTFANAERFFGLM